MRTLLRLAVPALAGLVSIAAQAEDARLHVTPYAPLFQEMPPSLGVRTGDLVRHELAAQDGVTVVELEAEAGAAPGVEAAKALERARLLAEQGWTALNPPVPEPAAGAAADGEGAAGEAGAAADPAEAPTAGGPVLPAQKSGPVLPATSGPVLPSDEEEKGTDEVATAAEAAQGEDAAAGEAVAQAPALPQPDPAQAASHFQAAIRLLEQNPEVLGDLSLLVELYRGRAIALAQAGQQAEAEDALAALARWRPEATHDWGEAADALTPAWDRVRREALTARRGHIELRSRPRGAQVRLDGQDVGQTPVRLAGLVPGTHWVAVSTPHARAWVRAVEVTAGEAVALEVGLDPLVEGPTAALLAALAKNELDDAAVAQAAAAGRAHGADWVVTGALTRVEDAYRVHSYLVEVESGRVSALPETSFDLDLISAAIEVYELAAGAKQQLAAAPEALALPVTPFPEARPTRPDLVVVQAGPPVLESGPVLPGAASGEARTAHAGEADEGGAPTDGAGATADGAEQAVAEASEPPRPTGPLGPIGPKEPEAQEPQRRERKGPLAAGAIEIDEEAEETAAATGPVGPVGPVGPAEPAAEEAVEEEAPRERQVTSISGNRERLDLGAEGDVNRFSAVDVEDIVIPEDEVGEERGWPWWAYGLVAAGVIAAGAGGYFVAQDAGVFGGTPTDATVSIRW